MQTCVQVLSYVCSGWRCFVGGTWQSAVHLHTGMQRAGMECAGYLVSEAAALQI